jgi:hypothetical protein
LNDSRLQKIRPKISEYDIEPELKKVADETKE